MTPDASVDLRWMDAAVRVARPYRGTTAENPVVAALVVDQGTGILISRAVTARGGRPHAETQALNAAGARAKGATLYVTLEPCNHWGRTPPCSDAIVKAGLGRVVVGLRDPDPRTAGQGVARIEAAGIPVTLLEHPPSRALNEGFVSRQVRGRPFVTLKLAVSADGMIGARGVGNHPVTGAVAKRWTHMQRALSDAVMVGGATARIDDPRLTVRLKGFEQRSHLRLVMAGAEGVDPKLNLIGGVSGYPTAIIALKGAAVPNFHMLDVIEVPPGRTGRPDIPETLKALGRRGINTLLVEGGARLTEAFLAAEAADRVHLLESPVSIGRAGLPATTMGTITGRLRGAGFIEVDRRALGDDMLRTFEKGL
ncbi:bifunctional diaminohydroxyphosphoribosylaminopyrimidine deaminase/5-amino-6-(5-phosphoribosylamino)uracil reductase RibD [Arsenicitalea aurantiaca]|uniref:Riboflavin biosynthesis protein RibD n=1 Tax=Arsenicitalea aurantiaca TaxID=1783274 RepID=A0A433XEL7_9HYPH|nr:bifunctional diaminohydroxyphosphoribosylaminopyrimidine deaminase/5-amino-6-(5-phosphoribosylamino)uracil reductase RibD [Arsenicitalea aurantiaca]RUT32541.1 bifunctional diaminohydroxyphosphoribosylaminopyrimidine deaminase/5-amino-6-(5-phosphoribosylamino)uracil reductase RibD [Arsenicitalea aurantiaca]